MTSSHGGGIELIADVRDLSDEVADGSVGVGDLDGCAGDVIDDVGDGSAMVRDFDEDARDVTGAVANLDAEVSHF